jgi:hypothetical protein
MGGMVWLWVGFVYILFVGIRMGGLYQVNPCSLPIAKTKKYLIDFSNSTQINDLIPINTIYILPKQNKDAGR